MENKKYTFEDWENGEVLAEKEKFSDEEWVKINKKQKSILKIAIEEKYKYWVDDFNQKYESSIDPNNFYKKKLLGLRYLFEKHPQFKVKELDEKAEYIESHEIVMFKYIYEQRTYGGVINHQEIKSFDLDKAIEINPEIEIAINVEVLYKFYKYLKEFDKSTESTEKIKDIIYHKQQTLILYYLINDGIIHINKISQDNTKKSQIIHALLNRDYSNTKKYLRKVFIRSDREIKTKMNLQKILPFFEKAGLEQIVNQIKQDLQNL